MQPDSDKVRYQLDRVLKSAGFSSADRLSRFLRYVVERTLAGDGDTLKEYTIGVDVFDRDAAYDPRVDSIVRVEAGRLRSKLDEYYGGEGRDDEVIIRVPKGSYAPAFESRQPQPSVVPVTNSSTSKARARLPGGRLAVGVFAAAAVLVAVVAWRAGVWTTGNRQSPTITIAVLPFGQYSSDPGDELLAARITDGVTSELARLGQVGVVSHTSALQIAGARRPIREVAQALNADLLMEATVVHEGERVRVNARLVDGGRDRKFWVDDFAGSTADLPDLQRRIATAASIAATTRPRR